MAAEGIDPEARLAARSDEAGEGRGRRKLGDGSVFPAGPGFTGSGIQDSSAPGVGQGRSSGTDDRAVG
ncbi:hypothetical protein AMK09_37850 [Streptomyces sp. CB02488]|nr:hypothetical protein AMK09_37850 [Streptomyces sp. CB02488]